MFNSTDGNWEVISTDVSIYMDEQIFANATDAGKVFVCVYEFVAYKMHPTTTSCAEDL